MYIGADKPRHQPAYSISRLAWQPSSTPLSADMIDETHQEGPLLAVAGDDSSIHILSVSGISEAREE